MAGRIRGAPFFFAAALFLVSAQGARADALRPFRFAALGDAPGGSSELFYGLGLEKGWFKDVGIDFQVRRTLANVAYAGIAAGEIDGTYFAASAVLAALRGAPLVAVYFPQPSVDWSLVVDPKKIKTPKDFTGARCVAGTGAKTATHVAWAAMIASIGGDPHGFQPVGLGQPAPYWIEALRVGTAACMMGFDGFWTRQAEHEGFKTLAYLPNVEPMQSHGLAVGKAAMAEPAKRRLIADVIGVFLRAQAYITAPEHRAEIAALVRKWMGAPKGLSSEDYLAAVNDMVKLYPPKGYIEDQGVFSDMLVTALKYGIFDRNDFPPGQIGIDPVEAGAVDQSVVREVAGWGPPLYRRP